MKELGEDGLGAAWQVVFDLDALARVVRSAVVDLQRLEGPERVRSLVARATDLEVVASDLRRSLISPADQSKIASYMTLIRQQSEQTAEEATKVSFSLPSAVKLIGARHQVLGATLNSLPSDLFLRKQSAGPLVDEHALAQTTMQIGTEIHEIRIRVLLKKPNSVLIVDGDNAAMEGWPDLPVLARRDALLTLLSTLRSKVRVAVMFDWHLGGREAIAPSNGVQVLLTSRHASLAHALLTLVRIQPAESSLVLVTDNREVIASAGELHGDLSGASSLALLRLLVDR